MADALRTIETAQAANVAFLAEQRQEINAPATLREKLVGSAKPWQLTFEQTVEDVGAYGSMKVKHDIKLTGGVNSRLRGMVNALTAAVEPVYESNNWSIVQPGDVYKVCSKISESYGAWSFLTYASKEVAGDLANPKWVVPAGLANPESALRAIFKIPADAATIKVAIDDVEYIVSEKYPEVIGQLATFKVERASYFKDKVAN